MIEFKGVQYTHCKKCLYCYDFEKCCEVSGKCADGCKGYFVDGDKIETLPFDGRLMEKEVE